MNVIRLYCIGVTVLIVAILANGMASKIQCKTWYDLIQGLTHSNSYWNSLELKDILWLFFAYPILLGIGSTLGQLIYQKLTSL
ncbi:MAG: hypothetical protein RLZZ248_192 [Bacteroidota bacterium]